jgi:hypothetical protein
VGPPVQEVTLQQQLLFCSQHSKRSVCCHTLQQQCVECRGFVSVSVARSYGRSVDMCLLVCPIMQCVNHIWRPHQALHIELFQTDPFLYCAENFIARAFFCHLNSVFAADLQSSRYCHHSSLHSLQRSQRFVIGRATMLIAQCPSIIAWLATRTLQDPRLSRQDTRQSVCLHALLVECSAAQTI